MIKFPVLHRLSVDGFSLYPGKAGDQDFDVELLPGLSLIVGANGLGKTTLVTILYRLLTGPYDIPALATLKDLGNAKLEATQLSPAKRKVFSARVLDGAKNATAKLNLLVGSSEIEVERRLSNLSLVSLSVDGIKFDVTEAEFQEKMLEKVGLWSFGDWILLLRHISFYFEDRRALVWDVSAQRQVLRLLFLSQEDSQEWSKREREILELDSRMRNLRFALQREEIALSETVAKTSAAAATIEELKALELLQKNETEQRDRLNADITESDSARKGAALRLLKARQERENRFRAYENAKLKAVESRFPNKSESARYIYEHLFSEENCLVCGNHAVEAASSIKERIDSSNCIVCGTDLSDEAGEILSTKLADKRLAKTSRELSEIEPELEQAIQEEEQAEAAFRKLVESLTALDASIANRSSKIDALVRQLPPDEAEMHNQRTELATMRGRLELLKIDLEKKRQSFSTFVASENRKLVKAAEEISSTFQDYAQGFLLEKIRLVWSPQKYKLGESGEPIEFPAFELEMTGASFAASVRRSGPDQVSESQREFIDLAFRMALVSVAGAKSASSLIIDAPESSLDAVFVRRAANVLASFAKSAPENRLVITSNLIEGDLLPRLLVNAGDAKNPLSRLVNLFELAEPTAAILELGGEYGVLLDDLKSRTQSLLEEGG